MKLTNLSLIYNVMFQLWSMLSNQSYNQYSVMQKKKNALPILIKRTFSQTKEIMILLILV